MATRDAGDGSPMFMFGMNPQDRVYEFNSSPFVQSHLKYCRNISFIHKSREYVVGDFVETKSRSIYRIEHLYYEKDCDVHPRLSIRGIKYIKASIYNATYEPPFHDHEENEVVCLNEKRSFYATFIIRKLSVVSKEKEELAHDYICRYSYEQDQLHPHTINDISLCDEFILQGIFLYLFYI